MAFLHEIYIADDHEAVRLGLYAALAQSEFQIVGQCRDHDEVVASLTRRVPEALILDFVMPGRVFADGMGYLRHLRGTYPDLPIMVLTMTRRPVLLQGMLDLGALGLFDKSASLRLLCTALRRIVGGETYLSESFASMVEPAAKSGTPRRLLGHALLSHSERLVLDALSEGHTLAEVGRRLDRSISTVSTLKRRAMQKLGMRSMHDLRDYTRRAQQVADTTP